jgi:hypothetical protein
MDEIRPGFQTSEFLVAAGVTISGIVLVIAGIVLAVKGHAGIGCVVAAGGTVSGAGASAAYSIARARVKAAATQTVVVSSSRTV